MEKDLIDDVIKSVEGIGEIIVVYLTHFFNGTPDLEAEETLKKHEVKKICIPWSSDSGNQAYWPGQMRKEAFKQSTKDWILFLDADEILRNKKNFVEWFSSIRDLSTPSYKLANYWYFLSKQRRAKPLEDSIFIIKRNK